MLTTLKKTLLAASTGSLLLSSSLVSADSIQYKVSITNLTNSINFTPILVSSQRRELSIFELGEPASEDLEAIAEGGDTSLLSATLEADSNVVDIQSTSDLLEPGQSVDVHVSAANGARYISLASMMLPTNDGFIAVNNVATARHGTVTYFSPGYDSGTELNDEMCFNIPGPTCAGTGPSDEPGEGYVHINRGIHGVGDLAADVYDWRNPVAKISITRVRVAE